MSSAIMEQFKAITANGELAAESRKQDREADLIPAGRYPFTVVEIRDTDQKEAYDDGTVNPLYGQPVARLMVKLEGVSAKGYDALDGKTRTWFFNVTPGLVYSAKGKLVGAAKLGGDMIEVSGTKGRPFSDTIEWFMSNKGEIVVRQFDGRDGSKANTAAAINKLA
jgi:hypothetical protein